MLEHSGPFPQLQCQPPVFQNGSQVFPSTNSPSVYRSPVILSRVRQDEILSGMMSTDITLVFDCRRIDLAQSYKLSSLTAMAAMRCSACSHEALSTYEVAADLGYLFCKSRLYIFKMVQTTSRGSFELYVNDQPEFGCNVIVLVLSVLVASSSLLATTSRLRVESAHGWQRAAAVMPGVRGCNREPFHADKGGTGCEASIMKPTMCLLNIKWNSHNIDIAYSF